MTLTIRHRYESIGEVLAVVESVPRREDRTSLKTTDSEWFGGVTLTESVALIRDGWTPGASALSAVMDRITLPDVNISRVTREWSVAGGAVSVGRLLGGDPLHRRRTLLSPSLPIVRIAVGYCASASFTAEQLMNTGAAVVAAVELLAGAGYGTELIAVDGRYMGENTTVTEIVVKQAHEPLDIETVAFVLAHPAMLRRVSFALNESESRSVRDVFGFKRGSSYAFPMHPVPVENVDIDLTESPARTIDAAIARVVSAITAWHKRSTGETE